MSAAIRDDVSEAISTIGIGLLTTLPVRAVVTDSSAVAWGDFDSFAANTSVLFTPSDTPVIALSA